MYPPLIFVHLNLALTLQLAFTLIPSPTTFALLHWPPNTVHSSCTSFTFSPAFLPTTSAPRREGERRLSTTLAAMMNLPNATVFSVAAGHYHCLKVADGAGYLWKDPRHLPFELFLFQAALVLTLSSLLHFLLKPFKQPLFVSQILVSSTLFYSSQINEWIFAAFLAYIVIYVHNLY